MFAAMTSPPAAEDW